MRFLSSWITATIVLAAVPMAVFAGAEKKKWDVEEPFGPTKEINFTTDEGTWMNLDVSPDGKHIVFDMLGDIYIMPINGGKATLLRGGPAFEVQPRFSPNGKMISYTSDKNGADNAWIMNADGSNPKQVTKEDFRLVNNPAWMPDGEYLVVKKHFTSERSIGAGEMWLYHTSGGKGLQLTKRKNDQQDVGEPCVSPDGRYVYFSEDMSGGTTFEYNKDPNGQIYMIRRYDREKGEIKNVITGPGGAVRPQVSPDGKHMAFVRRIRLKSVLHVQNLATGEVEAIYDNLYKDQQETWATFGVYPNYNWTPDGKKIVIWAKGKIWSVDVASKAATQIPFEVDAKHRVIEALRYKQDVSPDKFTAKMIRHGSTSPDGKWFVFSAVNKIYKKKLPDGEPERITNDDNWEYWPSFSADGKKIVYATYDDENLSAVRVTNLGGGGKKKLTAEKGYYAEPRFSPDGKLVVYSKLAGDDLLDYTYGVETGIYTVPANGGESKLIRTTGSRPSFSPDGKRIMFELLAEAKKYELRSVNLEGADERTHYTGKEILTYDVSPDGKWIAFTELYKGYIAPFTQTGKVVELGASTKSVPVQGVTRDAGTYLHWSGDSQKLHWTIGPEYFTRDLKDTFTFVEGAADSVAPIDTVGIDIGLTLDTDVPTGKIALTGARIITMNGDEVIENGTILVDKNRIVSVGTSADTDGYTVIDCAGKTIMPGLVDVHAHMWQSFSGISPNQSWHFLANLAFGVTTTHDPSNPTELVFTHAELVKSGAMVGPRIFSTGTILYGADARGYKSVVNSLDDARGHLRRMKAVGAISVKSYNQPRREQRQQVLKAARELEMMVVPEGGSFFFHNMTMVIDGHTGVEHTIPIAPIYKDVTSLWGQTGVGSTPTLVVGYGGMWGENYWYAKDNVWENERLMNFTPRRLVDARSRRRPILPEGDWGHFGLAKNCKELIDAGGKVQLGAHGQRQGLGSHWELWMFTQGGMTNMEALRCATLYGAEYVGLDDDIGSLEAGKLADLVVLDRNPLDDIYNSESVRYTMVNGRIYDAMTMNEIGNHPHERGLLWFERKGANDAHVWRGAAQGFEVDQCGCYGWH